MWNKSHCSLSRDQELTKVNEIEIRKMKSHKYRGPDNNGLYLNSIITLVTIGWQ